MQAPPQTLVHFLSSELHRLDRDTNSATLFSSLRRHPSLSVSHHTIFHATSLPHSLLALNDTVYTHPASIIPFHTSPGLFIRLGCWGDMKAPSLLLFLLHSLPPPFAFLLFFPSNYCWLLVAVDIRGLIKPWRSCLIYTGGVWVVARKCGKDTSHLFHYLLSYSPGPGEDPAQGSFCQLLDPAACFTFCTRVFSNKRLKVARWGWQKQTLLCYRSFPKSAVRGFVQQSMTAVAASLFSML